MATEIRPDGLTLREAAEVLGVESTFVILRWIQNGALHAWRMGDEVRISRVSVEALCGSDLVRAQQRADQTLNAVLDTLDAELTTEEILDLTEGTHRGQVPWSASVPVRA